MNLHDFGMKDAGSVTIPISPLDAIMVLVLIIAVVLLIRRVKNQKRRP